MKTIQLISECIDKMSQLTLPANIEVGTFKVISTGHLVNCFGNQGKYEGSVIFFNLRFRPDHIQRLVQMGVIIDFSSAAMADLSPNALRFKRGREAIRQGRYAPYYYMGDPRNAQTAKVENWLIAPAKCDIYTLKILDRYCRDNHMDEIAIDNDHNLRANGWDMKTKYAFGHSLLTSKIAKKIRQNIADKRKSSVALLPVESRAIEQKKYEI